MGSGKGSVSRSPVGTAMWCTVPVRDVLVVGLTGEASAHDALDRQHLGAPHEHRASVQCASIARKPTTDRSITAGSHVTSALGTVDANSWIQKSVSPVSTRPFSGIGSFITTSKALRRSEATISMQLRRRPRRGRGPCPSRGGRSARLDHARHVSASRTRRRWASRRSRSKARANRLVAQRDLVVALDDVAEVAALVDRAPRGALDDAVGVVAAHPRLDEGEQHRLREDEAERAVSEIRRARARSCSTRPSASPVALRSM